MSQTFKINIKWWHTSQLLPAMMLRTFTPLLMRLHLLTVPCSRSISLNPAGDLLGMPSACCLYGFVKHNRYTFVAKMQLVVQLDGNLQYALPHDTALCAQFLFWKHSVFSLQMLCCLFGREKLEEDITCTTDPDAAQGVFCLRCIQLSLHNFITKFAHRSCVQIGIL